MGGHGIERSWRKACQASNGKTKLDHNLKPTEVFALAESGNAVANKILVESAQTFADAISNISLVLNSSMVVLGGEWDQSASIRRSALSAGEQRLRLPKTGDQHFGRGRATVRCVAAGP